MVTSKQRDLLWSPEYPALCQTSYIHCLTEKITGFTVGEKNMVLIFQVRKLRSREVKWFARSQWWSWHLYYFRASTAAMTSCKLEWSLVGEAVPWQIYPPSLKPQAQFCRRPTWSLFSPLIAQGSWGFPYSSVGKESACNAGDPSSIPGSGRSPQEGIGCPFQCSQASLVTQLAKNLPAMWET